MFIKIFIILGLFGGVFAFVMAFLITYEEYQHHFKDYRLYKEALSIAIMAFLVIVIMMIFSGVFLNVTISNK